ncbi:MAG: TetR/AcrR family transcriptional regulator [Rhodobacteraceae bacterium]|nr:TetR/AcrR family transcriptional regulator [Paracoccaceae bacterium]
MTDATANTGKQTRSARRTESREVRRRQLIDATIESISRHGISGTTMSTVTGLAGLSTGIVNFHFKNKETLFEDTLRFLGREHRDQWRNSVRDAALRPEAKLLAIVDAHFHPDICSRKKLAVWFGFYGEAGYRGQYRQIMSEIDEERWETSIRLCQNIIADGGYDDVEAEDVASTLEGLYDGFCLNILIYPGEFSHEDAKAQIRAYLAGVFPKHFETPRSQPCEA